MEPPADEIRGRMLVTSRGVTDVLGAGVDAEIVVAHVNELASEDRHVMAFSAPVGRAPVENHDSRKHRADRGERAAT